MIILKKCLLLTIIMVISLGFLAISNSPIVKHDVISPQEVKDAVDNYSHISQQLFEKKGVAEIELAIEDLESISKAGTYLVPYLKTHAQLIDDELTLFASLDLSSVMDNTYINAHCVLKNSDQTILDFCYLGRIYLPSFMVRLLAHSSLTILQQPNLKDLFDQMLQQSRIQDNKLNLWIAKRDNLKQALKYDAKQLVGNFNFLDIRQRSEIDYGIIIDYLHEFSLDETLQGSGSISLAIVFNKAFNFAQLRSLSSDSVNENLHALFAIAITFANPNFTQILQERGLAEVLRINNILATNQFKQAHIDGRHDLTLHFLYSAVIEQLTNDKLAFNAGELKELYDANRGARYFDFTDITADIAGAIFSKFIASTQENAIRSQQLLANNVAEHLFFPNTAAYPKSIEPFVSKQAAFSTENKAYSAMLSQIHLDIQALRLYR